MKGLFNLDNRFFCLLSRMTDFVVLNVLFVITSIPIITIGASATALCLTAREIRKKQDGYLYRGYLLHFKANLFSKKTIIWMIIIVAQIMLFVDFWLTHFMDISYRSIIVGILYGIELMLLIFVPFVFFSDGEKTTVKEQICETIFLIGKTTIWGIPLIILTYTPVIMCIIFPECIPMIVSIFVLIGFALIGYFQAVFITKNEAEEIQNVSM